MDLMPGALTTDPFKSKQRLLFKCFRHVCTLVTNLYTCLIFSKTLFCFDKKKIQCIVGHLSTFLLTENGSSLWDDILKQNYGAETQSVKMTLEFGKVVLFRGFDKHKTA